MDFGVAICTVTHTKILSLAKYENMKSWHIRKSGQPKTSWHHQQKHPIWITRNQYQ